jgi:hypothetical protein
MAIVFNFVSVEVKRDDSAEIQSEAASQVLALNMFDKSAKDRTIQTLEVEDIVKGKTLLHCRWSST